jgi:hypothetical protein
MVLEFVDNLNSNSNEFLFQIRKSRFRLKLKRHSGIVVLEFVDQPNSISNEFRLQVRGQDSGYS